MNYIYIFHSAIATNDFLYMINKRNIQLCDFCNKEPESIHHLLAMCSVDNPLWQRLEEFLSSKLKRNFTFTVFERLFWCKDQGDVSTCIDFYIMY